MPNGSIDPGFLSLLSEGFALGPDSAHGPAHWQRVRINGLLLAAETGAKAQIVELFALLHDTK